MIFLRYHVIEEIIDTLSPSIRYETLYSSPSSVPTCVLTVPVQWDKLDTRFNIYTFLSQNLSHLSSYLLRQSLFPLPLGPPFTNKIHRIFDLLRWPALFFHSTIRDNGNYLMKITGFAPLLTLANRATTTLHR